MDSETKAAIKSAALPLNTYLVEVKIGGKVVSLIQGIKARDTEHAKEKAFYLLRFNVKKDYDTKAN